jgi:hypothetical protein
VSVSRVSGMWYGRGRTAPANVLAALWEQPESATASSSRTTARTGRIALATAYPGGEVPGQGP